MSEKGPQSHLHTIKIGDRIDKFEVVDQIGAGGSSIVWKAFDQLLNRHVAIKQIIPENGLDDEVRDRFRREASIQKRIASKEKHLVNIEDVLDESRGLFIVMEYVDGPSLEQYMAQRRSALEQRQAVGILAATAAALDVIHGQGIIHRDLKPSNILLPVDGGLKVCDFGLSVLAEMQENMEVGTVRYMAPEMFLNEKLDARADLYALGIIAYEMLGGRERFDEAFKLIVRDHRNQAMRWMKWHTNPRAVAPPLNQLNPEIPENLSDLIARLMEKDRDKRIASAKDLIEAIRRIIAGKPVDPQELESARVRTEVNENPTAALPKRGKLKLILAANLLLIAAGVGIWQVIEHNTEAQAQWEVFNQARTEYEEASAKFDEAIRRDLEDADREPDIAALARARETFERLAAQWPSDVWIAQWSRVKSTVAAAYIENHAGNYDQALRHFDKAKDLNIRARTGERHPIRVDDLTAESRKPPLLMTTRDRVDRVRQLVLARQFGEADIEMARLREDGRRGTLPISEFEDLLDRLEARAGSLADSAWLTEMRQRYQGYFDQQDFASARRTLEEVRQSDRHVSEEDLAWVTEQFRTMQNLEQQRTVLEQLRRSESDERWADAVDAATRAIDLFPDRRDELERRIQTFRANQAYAEAQRFLARGQQQQAAARFRDARDLGHPRAEGELEALRIAEDYSAMVDRGRAAMERREWEQAINIFNEAQQVRSNPEIAQLIRQAEINLNYTRGRQALTRQELDDAERAFRRVIQLDRTHAQAQRRLNEVQQWKDYHTRLNEGREALAKNAFSEARQRFREAREIHDTEEIQAAIRELEYSLAIFNARRHMDERNWVQARSSVRTASRYRSTEEAQRLMEIIQAEIDRIEAGG
ncbi:MAG: protein kinase [Phycisphaeraceae bacterium]|nr:protein kinase [Phycisphaeraceae bacterium]